MMRSASMMMVSRTSPYAQLEEIASKLGLEVLKEGGRDVTFVEGVIRVGDSMPETQFEERLAHELGHFLVAPKSRRWKENYGHEGYALLDRTKEREELAASVLGMALQVSVGSRINMYEKAYLWNLWEQPWHKFGFWIGAEILLKMGWIGDSFRINKQKLMESYTWKRRSF